MPFGLSLLLVICLVLTLSAFAAVTLSQAHNEAEMADTSLAAKKAYNDAVNQAEEHIAEAQEKAAASGVHEDLAFAAEISSTSYLAVECTWNENTGTYETTRFQTVSAENWQSETTLPVIH